MLSAPVWSPGLLVRDALFAGWSSGARRVSIANLSARAEAWGFRFEEEPRGVHLLAQGTAVAVVTARTMMLRDASGSGREWPLTGFDRYLFDPTGPRFVFWSRSTGRASSLRLDAAGLGTRADFLALPGAARAASGEGDVDMRLGAAAGTLFAWSASRRAWASFAWKGASYATARTCEPPVPEAGNDTREVSVTAPVLRDAVPLGDGTRLVWIEDSTLHLGRASSSCFESDSSADVPGFLEVPDIDPSSILTTAPQVVVGLSSEGPGNVEVAFARGRVEFAVADAASDGAGDGVNDGAEGTSATSGTSGSLKVSRRWTHPCPGTRVLASFRETTAGGDVRYLLCAQAAASASDAQGSVWALPAGGGTAKRVGDFPLSHPTALARRAGALMLLDASAFGRVHALGLAKGSVDTFGPLFLRGVLE
jgi:hypothetical protein